MLKIHLRHLKYIATIRKEHITTITIFSHILILTFFKGFQFFRIVTFYPACLIQTDRLPTALSIVFVFQTILNNLKLQLSYRTNNLTAIELINNCATPSSIS